MSIHGPNQPPTTAQEELMLIHVALVSLSALVGSAGLLWLKGAQWLVAHQILVPDTANPLLTVPGTGGAGLDAARAMVAGGVLLGALVVALSAVVDYWRRGQGIS